MEKTHNLEVTGSSPVWSTLKYKQLRGIATAFFFYLRTKCEQNAMRIDNF